MKHESGHQSSYLNPAESEKNILYTKMLKISIKVKNCIKTTCSLQPIPRQLGCSVTVAPAGLRLEAAGSEQAGRAAPATGRRGPRGPAHCKFLQPTCASETKPCRWYDTTGNGNPARFRKQTPTTGSTTECTLGNTVLTGVNTLLSEHSRTCLTENQCYKGAVASFAKPGRNCRQPQAGQEGRGPWLG